MPRLLLSIAFLCVFFNVRSQSLRLEFDSPVHDFGAIRETGGPVTHIFQFTNTEKFPVTLVQIGSSCGCTVPYVSEKTIAPGAKGSVRVEYDPSGRPGKFVRSVEIQAEGGGLSHTFFLNLRGTVISRELLPEAENPVEKGAVLQLRPFVYPVVNTSDFRLLHDRGLQDFINDLTYEIDQHELATVRLELFYPKGSGAFSQPENLFLPVKKFLISELESRNYSPHQIAFKEEKPVADQRLESAYLKISSLLLNNDSIPESGYYFPGPSWGEAEASDVAENDSVYFSGRVHTLHRQSAIDRLNRKEESYLQFLEESVRLALMLGRLELCIRLSGEGKIKNEEKERRKLLKTAVRIEKELLRDLQKAGIPESQVAFAVPVIRLLPGDKPLDYELMLASLFPALPAPATIAVTDSLRSATHEATAKRYQAPLQHLPVYRQHFSYRQKFTDTTRSDFRNWAQVIATEIKAGKKISLLLESSASNSPTLKKYDNAYVSRKRATDATDRLIQYFKNLGVPVENLKFQEPVCLVQGPAYDDREFAIEFYDRFQYVKIIPVYDTIGGSLAELFPYQVNFSYNNFELPVQSEIFQLFTDRLLPVIDRQGYVKLIIESSSSKVPTRAHSGNEILSFHRADRAREKLYEEIRRRGYDPLRVIVSEERILVQGPEHQPEFNQQSRIYERYQYLKIIPEHLLRP